MTLNEIQHIDLRFYAQLNDFLPAQRQQVLFAHSVEGTPAIKDTIESLGVPHTEVGLIVVNNLPVDFEYRICNRDHISVYPAFESIDISSIIHVQPPAPATFRFIADIHLGRLTAYLRMLGFDTLYPEDYRDENLARIAADERRILLTRDLGLLKRSIVEYGYFVRATDPWQQLEEIVRRFGLMQAITEFNRCTKCNHLLKIVDKTTIADRLQPKTIEYYDEFRQCSQCDRLYWRGSHYGQMDEFLQRLTPPTP